MKIPNRFQLADIPTPLQQVLFEGTKFYVKRDDYSGIEYSGNKIRKLEYLLYEAVNSKADYIFTCGGEQSNHARATTAAAVRYGIRPRLFLWGREQSSAGGNLFINKFLGADITYLTRPEFENVNELMTEERNKYEAAGKKVYVVPEGGSTTLGMWGYINFIHELVKQVDTKKIKNIFVAAGTGGTAAGLMTGIALNKLDMKVSAVNVLYPKQVIRNKIQHLVEGCSLDFSLDVNPDPGMLEIIDGYSDEGYKNIEPAKIRLIRRFAESTGIILDPAYTGKAFNAFYDLVIKKQRKDALFIHTGGLFAVFSRIKEYLA